MGKVDGLFVALRTEPVAAEPRRAVRNALRPAYTLFLRARILSAFRSGGR